MPSKSYKYIAEINQALNITTTYTVAKVNDIGEILKKNHYK